MLRITIHDDPRSLTLQLEGKLAGPWVREAEICWQRTLSGNPQLVRRFDLTGVTLIDPAGKAFLAAAHAQGAELVASGCLMRAIVAADAQAHAVQVDIERSVVRSPLAAEVLQVKLRVGEFAPAAPTAVPLILLGRSKPLHVRVDVDEHEAWRVREGARAVGHARGHADLKAPLQFVRFEPFVVPKRSLTGDSTERVDTRVLQVIYRIDGNNLPLFVGQQLDVFIDAGRPGGGTQ